MCRIQNHETYVHVLYVYIYYWRKTTNLLIFLISHIIECIYTMYIVHVHVDVHAPLVHVHVHMYMYSFAVAYRLITGHRVGGANCEVAK